MKCFRVVPPLHEATSCTHPVQVGFVNRSVPRCETSHWRNNGIKEFQLFGQGNVAIT